ncbi:class I SAM-dependent methyltransferase [Nocardiopsis deserti]|uniref:class I SAM-dependent methyltransferase n=1 Tax=Nocardiopsis deserti TaxID=2605988 RepID=UPI00123B7252|nr:class I SAM-dependent methyltransferase [Nocardiopsis deserti]
MTERPISAYYDEAPEIYAAVARDRDFSAQTDVLDELVPEVTGRRRRLLELFAGPAYHSVEAQRRGWGVTAVDSSPRMRDLALADGFADPDAYVVGPLPDALGLVRADEPVDCVLAARYSLGHLDRSGLDLLLAGLAPFLRSGGVVLLELHDIAMVTAGLDHLDIQVRSTRLPDGTRVRCHWPDGPMDWRSDDHVVRMPVRIEVTTTDGRQHALRYLSTEHVHSAAETAYMAARHGLRTRTRSPEPDELGAAFPGAVVLVLEKE